MARCAHRQCGRWRPDRLARAGHLGVALGDVWFCSRPCLAAHTRLLLEDEATTVETPARGVGQTTALRLGVYLLAHQVITGETLRIALREQRQSGRRLGAELVALGLASQDEVVRALAAQAGIGYLTSVDLRRVAAGPGDLSPEAVRAIGVVPIDTTEAGRRLRVVCQAPLPRLALAALRHMTGGQVESFLVSDDLWRQVREHYAQDRPSTATAPHVRTIPAAAERIADAAGRGTLRRMQHARCDPFVWVRLEGDDLREDLLLSAASSRKDVSWPVVPTSH
jgi:hypothetical protein